MEDRYKSIDKCVCNHCVSDKHIKQFIRENGEESKCDYCGKKRAKTVSFDEFIKFFLEHIEYGDPREELVNFDDSEPFGINELLDKCDIDLTKKPALYDDVVDFLIDREWCEKPYYRDEESDVLKAGWEEFVKVVKHKSRYAFYQLEEEYLYNPIPPSEFLDVLSNIISRLNLYKTLDLLRLNSHIIDYR